MQVPADRRARCISWTGDFLFMAHYNWLFSQVPPQKMFKDYSPFGVHEEIDACFPSPRHFSPSFSSYFPCYVLKWVIRGHNVIGFSYGFYFSVLKLCTFRARLTYSVNYQCFYFLLEVKFKLGFVDPGSLLSCSSF